MNVGEFGKEYRS